MSWICSNCGTEYPDSVKECTNSDCKTGGNTPNEEGALTRSDISRENRKTRVWTAGMIQSESEPAPTKVWGADNERNSSHETKIFSNSRRETKKTEKLEHQLTQRGGPGFHVVVPPSKPKCSLTLIPEDGENVEALKRNFEGESIILNRANTEPVNHTITSREHAVLIFKDGQWFIEDRSTWKTTFIQVIGQKPLQPGDVIALGDRRFKFETE